LLTAGQMFVKPRPHQQHVEATCRIRHVEATCRTLLRHVERFFPSTPQVACCFDMLLRHVAGVDGAVRNVECRMLQVACCFDMLLVWTGL